MARVVGRAAGPRCEHRGRPARSTVRFAIRPVTHHGGSQAGDFLPPEFAELAGAPALQERCRRYWADLAPGWDIVGGVKWDLTNRLHEQIQRVNLYRIVKASARAAGRCASAPFALRVDLVQWPADYRRAVTDAHVVLGVHFLERGQVEALREVLRRHIVRLV
jgi:hypothetical protein